MRHAIWMVHLHRPDGYLRDQLVQDYAVETGLTTQKSNEHIELLVNTGKLLEDDLHIFTTKPGLGWAGVKSELDQEIEEGRKGRRHTRTQTQKAGSPTDEKPAVSGGVSP